MEGALKSRGISYVLIDGSLNLEGQRTHLRKFHDDSQTQILSMAAGTGAAG